MDFVYFVLLISVLIFIHELGHYTCAKIFNVKVLTFSLGFGPKILKLRGKETEYCIGLLPLGGFVKMLERARGDVILPEDEHRTFEAQRLWKRIVIVLAGPAMNVVFPIVLYTSVYLDDTTFLPPTVGSVIPGKPADGKLMTGDRILSVDGTNVTTFPEVQRIIGKRANKPTKLSLLRDGKTVEVEVVPADEIDVHELDIVEHVGRIGFQATFGAPTIGVPRTDSPAYRAGLRTFDRITSINGRKVDRMVDLIQTLSSNHGDTLVLAYMRPQSVPNAAGGLVDVAVLEPRVATLTPLAATEPHPADNDARYLDVLARCGIETSDLHVAFVPPGSSEWKAGLRSGDRLTALDGVPIRLWQMMEDDLLRGASHPRRLEWTREGIAMAGSFQLQNEAWDDEFGQHYERYVFRTTHWIPSAPDETVPNPHRFLYALERGTEETWRTIEFIAVGFLRLLEGRLSLRAVSGPITLYDVAGQAGAKGTSAFVRAMAIISVNLGLINLLPIPVLDGGHLAFFLIEAARRKPLERRTREIASLIGMTMLFFLMALAFKNDVERHWGTIVVQFRELFS